MFGQVHYMIWSSSIFGYMYVLLLCEQNFYLRTHTLSLTQSTVSPHTSPPPTAPKSRSRLLPNTDSHAHMGSLRHPLGSPEGRRQGLTSPEGTVPDVEDQPTIAPAHSSHGGVSHKIQQLLNTLKRPRNSKKPVEDYYHDDEVPGEMVLNYMQHSPLKNTCLHLSFGSQCYTGCQQVKCSCIVLECSLHDFYMDIQAMSMSCTCVYLLLLYTILLD